MKKTITVYILGEKFQIALEDDFLKYIKDDLLKIQNPTPKELLFFILEKNKKEYELLKKVEEKIKDKK